MRRPEVASWTRLALCPSCIDAGRAEGYPVLS
jgi:hypothetical protein